MLLARACGHHASGSVGCISFFLVRAIVLTYRPISRISAEQVVLHDAPECPNTVSPADLLAFEVRAPVIRNTHFIDATPHLGNLGGDLRFKTETLLFDLKLLQDVATEDLVAGFHVSEVEVGEAIGNKSEQFVAEIVPEEKNTMRIATDEAGAVNDIGAFIQDGLDQFGIVIGIVFKVSILNDNDVPFSNGETSAERCTFSLVEGVMQDTDIFLLRKLLQDFSGAVGGAIVYENNLLLNGNGLNALDELGDGMHFIKNGYHDRAGEIPDLLASLSSGGSLLRNRRCHVVGVLILLRVP
jgi:hypothetical protein